MFSAFFKGIGQLGDPASRGVVLISIGLALLTFAFLWSCVGFLLARTALFEIAWLESMSDILGGLATLVLTWFLFPGIMSAAIGLFLERIVGAVEAAHYPHLPAVIEQELSEALVSAAKFLLIMIGANLFALLFLLTPLFPFVFYSVNGYLVGREFFEMVAVRRVGLDEARALRKAHNGAVFAIGVTFALLLTVPIINLLTPIVATATMVHLFEAWRHADGRLLTQT